jgi:hypothetical protein
MNDEWRLQIDAVDAEQAKPLVERLNAGELEHDLSLAFADRVIVSRDQGTVYLYAGSRLQLENAREVVRGLTEEHGWQASTELARWHPSSEEWEDADTPLPESDAARLAEHEALVASEREEVAEGAPPQFEVRVDLPSHHDAVRFAEILEAEGLPTVRRWKYLVLGAADQDSADALAERVRGEAPDGSEVGVEGSGKVVYDERPPNPFAIFGGLGG